MTSVFIVELLSGNKVNVAYLTDWSHFSHKVNTNTPYTSNHKRKEVNRDSKEGILMTVFHICHPDDLRRTETLFQG